MGRFGKGAFGIDPFGGGGFGSGQFGVGLQAPIGGIDVYTKLMLHFDNNLTDSEITPKTITNTGSVTFDNTPGKYKFGGFAASFNGSSQYATAADSNDWTFGSSDFTIDCWINLNSLSGQQDIVGQFADTGNWWDFYYNGADQITFAVQSSATYIGYYQSINLGLSTGTLYHIQFSRFGSTAFFFLNGVSISLTQLFAWGTLSNLAAVLRIGNVYNLVAPFNGYIDELRISNGIARNTSNFTPPSGPYTL